MFLVYIFVICKYFNLFLCLIKENLNFLGNQSRKKGIWIEIKSVRESEIAIEFIWDIGNDEDDENGIKDKKGICKDCCQVYVGFF